MEPISELISHQAQSGKLEWIGIRPERRIEIYTLNEVEITLNGLVGDHNQTGGKRAITILQQEHLPVIAAFLGIEIIKPKQLRRNLTVSGINILGFRNKQFQIGEAILEGTGICAPCSRMEEEFGHGGYAAVRGHGGITAKIIKEGKIATGDKVTLI